MKKTLLLLNFCILAFALYAQSISEKLVIAFKKFESDPQLKHAISSLYVIDAKTGKVVFDKNSQVGLAGASTQKIFTATTAFELLGKDFRYETELGCDGEIKNNLLSGNLFVVGSGDPTFGSWRYSSTKRDTVLNEILSVLNNNGIKKIRGNIILDNSKFSYQPLPGGWIWEDIGNYYGAGVWGINWNENQFDLLMKPGEKENDSVEILKTDPPLQVVALTNLLQTGKAGSGDNAYIYLPPYSASGFVEGTVPAGEKSFIISGSMPFPANQLISDLAHLFSANGFQFSGNFKTSEDFTRNKQSVLSYKKLLEKISSPSLDSIVYWFLKKSINLYGEALVKTFSFRTYGFGSTDSGVSIMKNFWKEKGLDESEINICDGSGLSPLNRITTHAQVEVLKYAKTKDWFPYFYDALPEYNNMKMKSGSISGVKGFAGYHTSKKGNEYIFSFLINNYNGSPSLVVEKMFRVLDVLK